MSTLPDDPDDTVYINWAVPRGFIQGSAGSNVIWQNPAVELEFPEGLQFAGTLKAVGPEEFLDGDGTPFISFLDFNWTSAAGLRHTTRINLEVEEITENDLVAINSPLRMKRPTSPM